MNTSTILILILAVSAPLCAQSSPAPADGDGAPAIAAEAALRSEEIAKSREQKALQLEKDSGSKLERRILAIRNSKYVEEMLGSPDGFATAFGGLPVAQGFAAGVQYRRRDLLDGRLQIKASVRASIRQAHLIDLNMALPHLANDRVFLNFYGFHSDSPNMQYFGPGPESSKNGRSVYRLEQTGFEVKSGARLTRSLSAGLLGKLTAVNVGRGDNPALAPIEQTYSPALAPGIDRQSRFLETGAFLQFDSRNFPGEPTRGGFYKAQYEIVSDRDLRTGSFNRLDLDAQQYVPFFQDKRVLAFRSSMSLTDHRRGQTVPFYMQPVLGGSDSLRGYRPYRFYDDNSMLFTAEYRYEIFSGLDMALFADAGKVFHNWEPWDAGGLQSDVGFGFRFNTHNNVFLRVDTAFSHEGFQIWFKFNNVF